MFCQDSLTIITFILCYNNKHKILKKINKKINKKKRRLKIKKNKIKMKK